MSCAPPKKTKRSTAENSKAGMAQRYPIQNQLKNGTNERINHLHLGISPWNVRKGGHCACEGNTSVIVRAPIYRPATALRYRSQDPHAPGRGLWRVERGETTSVRAAPVSQYMVTCGPRPREREGIRYHEISAWNWKHSHWCVRVKSMTRAREEFQ